MAGDVQLSNELEQLGTIATAAHDQTWTGAAAERYAVEVLQANAAIAARLVEAGYPPDVAREVVATWIILGRSSNYPEWSVLGCVDFYYEHIEPRLRRRADRA